MDKITSALSRNSDNAAKIDPRENTRARYTAFTRSEYHTFLNYSQPSEKNTFDLVVNNILNYFGRDSFDIKPNSFCKKKFTIGKVELTSYQFSHRVLLLNENYYYLNKEQKLEFNKLVTSFNKSYILWKKVYNYTIDSRIKSNCEQEFNEIVETFVQKMAQLSKECDANMLAEMMTIHSNL